MYNINLTLATAAMVRDPIDTLDLRDEVTTGAIAILGIRGVPAAHGGFETFAEKLAPYLVKKGHKVTVYCQDDSHVGASFTNRFHEDEWEGVRRVHVKVAKAGAMGTMEFDYHSVLHSSKEDSVKLVLGYNTACFTSILRLKGHNVITNMDGIEWKRAKWSWKAKAWFIANEWAGAWISNRMIADHPEIANHLAFRRSRSRTVMIPYGADEINTADVSLLGKLQLEPNEFYISIARIEKENSILEMVEAFSREKRGKKLVVLGTFDKDNAYHNEIKKAASDEVVFTGAIYHKPLLHALRFYARAYCHGHTVGGTNPSLVESMMAGNAVIAHDNKFNRWTAGDGQFFFKNADDAAKLFKNLSQSQESLDSAKIASRLRALEQFQWDDVLESYEETLRDYF
jgi:glycosyltransferase involved in cell wall biosynthesis